MTRWPLDRSVLVAHPLEHGALCLLAGHTLSNYLDHGGLLSWNVLHTPCVLLTLELGLGTNDT